MAKRKKNIKKEITVNTYVMACRCGEFEANKDVTGRTRKSIYKSKKTYSRKSKHKIL